VDQAVNRVDRLRQIPEVVRGFRGGGAGEVVGVELQRAERSVQLQQGEIRGVLGEQEVVLVLADLPPERVRHLAHWLCHLSDLHTHQQDHQDSPH